MLAFHSFTCLTFFNRQRFLRVVGNPENGAGVLLTTEQEMESWLHHRFSVLRCQGTRVMFQFGFNQWNPAWFDFSTALVDDIRKTKLHKGGLLDLPVFSGFLLDKRAPVDLIAMHFLPILPQMFCQFWHLSSAVAYVGLVLVHPSSEAIFSLSDMYSSGDTMNHLFILVIARFVFDQKIIYRSSNPVLTWHFLPMVLSFFCHPFVGMGLKCLSGCLILPRFPSQN